MDKKALANGLALIAIFFIMVAIIGGLAGGSHRWVEPFEQAGWMFMVGSILVMYAVPDGEQVETVKNSAQLRAAAWAFGAVAIVMFAVGLIANASLVVPRRWFEPVELAGILATLVTIVTAVMSRGGWRAR